MFIWFFALLLTVFNTALSAQQAIVKAAVETFMNSGKLMVFSEEYNKDTFENMLNNISSDSTKIYLQSVIDQNPNSAIAYHNIGVVYFLDKEFSKASQNWEIALSKDSCLVNATIGLTIIHTLNKRYPKAIKYLEGVTNCNYHSPDLYYLKGLILIARGKFKESLMELNKAIKAQPQNYLYLHSRCYVFLHLGADRKAIEDLTHSYELNPVKSKDYQGSRFFKRYQIRCEFMLTYFKQHKEELAWNIRELLEVGIGNLLKKMDSQSAWNKFTQALKLSKKEHPLIYYLIAVSAFYHEDKFYYYDKALELDSNIYDAYRKRGLLYFSVGENQKALADFEELVRLKPDLYISYREKSSILLTQGKWEEAVHTCSKAIQLNEGDDEVFFNRGKAFSRMQEHQKALEDYNHILQRTSENISVFFAQGNAHLALKQYKEALITCDSILNISPNSPKGHNLKGVVYMNEEKYEPALACFDESILLAPNYLEAHFNRALTYFRFKDFVAAFRDINKAIKLYNNDAEYYYLRAAIKKELKRKTACEDIQKALKMGMYLEEKEVDRICEQEE